MKYNPLYQILWDTADACKISKKKLAYICKVPKSTNKNESIFYKVYVSLEDFVLESFKSLWEPVAEFPRLWRKDSALEILFLILCTWSVLGEGEDDYCHWAAVRPQASSSNLAELSVLTRRMGHWMGWNVTSTGRSESSWGCRVCTSGSCSRE